MKYYFLFFVSLVGVSNCFDKSCRRGGHGSEYTYERRDLWPKLYPTCAGKHQSPINIDTSSRNTRRVELNRALDLSQYSKTITNATIENTGHKISVLVSEKIQISGGPALDDTYELQEFHLHFGKYADDGSEHSVDHELYAMEIHFVHMNTKYASKEEAQNNTDGYIVIGVFVEEDQSNKDDENIAFISDNISSIKTPSKIAINGPIYLNTLIPLTNKKHGYWTYSGSLTTPLCYEAVTWVLDKEALGLSSEVMNKFRCTRDKCGKKLAGNVRRPQPLNGRTIFSVSKSENQI